MTARTRRRLLVCLLLALITLPAEAVVLPALLNPSPAAAARAFVADLGPDGVQLAALDIHAWPYHHRRAIMAALTSDERATVWQRHFREFQTTHPDLDASQRAVIERAIQLASPDLFNGQPALASVQDQLNGVYAAASLVFGKNTARELFFRLGPDRGGQSSQGGGGLSPLASVTDWLRTHFVANADSDPDCQCWDLADCELPLHSYYCTETITCNVDIDFPMCGPLWCYACVGTCKWRWDAN